MQSKLALSALVIASMVGATAIASAQTQPATQPAPGASSEGNVGPGADSTRMKSGKMKTKSDTTTGMSGGTASSHKGARNPPAQGNVGPGTGPSSGGK
jgi:hypothetical protein